MTKSKKTYGAVCHAGGRKIEIVSEHQEWLRWALRVLYAAEENRVMGHDELAQIVNADIQLGVPQ